MIRVVNIPVIQWLRQHWFLGTHHKSSHVTDSSLALLSNGGKEPDFAIFLRENCYCVHCIYMWILPFS